MSDVLMRPGQVASPQRYDYNVVWNRVFFLTKSSAGIEEMATREVMLCCRLL